MIPYPIPSLTSLRVLVTRPAHQANSLCARIGSLGGEAILFPTIAIEVMAPEAMTGDCDWLIFVSANAVQYGLAHTKRNDKTRIAAIGKATAAALKSHEVRIDAVPEADSHSEALLAHPALANVSALRVTIVKGVGGRELLQDALVRRGAAVTMFDVYRRVRPIVAADAVQALEQLWQENGVDIVTLTSVETLDNLWTMLTDTGRALLVVTPFVTLSERIAAAARSRGLTGYSVLSQGADDDSVIGAIAAWHARAR